MSSSPNLKALPLTPNSTLKLTGSPWRVLRGMIILGWPLTFRPHIDKLLYRGNQRLFSLSKIRKFIPTCVAVLIYKALIMSVINYGGMLCTGASKLDLSRIQKFQNRALRVCTYANRYTSNISLHRDTNVLPLYLRRKLETYKLMYSRMLNAEQINPACDSRPVTRFTSSRPPVFDRPKSCRFLNSITYQAPKLWSELQSQVKNMNDSSYFDREIRKVINAEMAQLTSLWDAVPGHRLGNFPNYANM